MLHVKVNSHFIPHTCFFPQTSQNITMYICMFSCVYHMNSFFGEKGPTKLYTMMYIFSNSTDILRIYITNKHYATYYLLSVLIGKLVISITEAVRIFDKFRRLPHFTLVIILNCSSAVVNNLNRLSQIPNFDRVYPFILFVL